MTLTKQRPAAIISGERVFRAGLPQGSVLSPLLFLLWAAPLARALRTVVNNRIIREDRVAIYLRHVKHSVQIKAGEPGTSARRVVGPWCDYATNPA